MVNPQLKETLKQRCKIALITIDAVAQVQDSDIVLRVLQSAREDMEAFQSQLDNPELTDERARNMNADIIARLDAFGNDLIAYGALIFPSGNNN